MSHTSSSSVYPVFHLFSYSIYRSYNSSLIATMRQERWLACCFLLDSTLGFTTSFRPSQLGPQQWLATPLSQSTPPDMDVIFGSSNQSSGGVSWGADDDFQEEDDAMPDDRQVRMERVAKLMTNSNKNENYPSGVNLPISPTVKNYRVSWTKNDSS